MPDKRTINFNPVRAKQRGAILIIMLVIMIIGITVVLVNSLTSSRVKNARQQTTAAALAQAKDALIGFAITYGDTHSGMLYGYLPCPDTSGSTEGSANPPCSSQDVNVVGRLPWRTLGLPVLSDGDGECLWYAVSGNYKDSPKTAGMMNWDTNGQFQGYAADGTLLSNEVVAVVIAPGATQPGQDRSGTTAPVCGGNYTVTNYLDNVTLHGINNTNIAAGKFIQGTSGGTVNDQMLFITRQDIWSAFQKRTDIQPGYANNPLRLMTQQVALCLANYGKQNNTGAGYGGSWWWSSSDKSLPRPAPVLLGTNQPGDYAVNANYNDSSTTLYTGRVPYNVGTSQGLSSNNNSTLMTSANCPSGWTPSIDLWWNNWKDQLFYALSYAFRPSGYTGQLCGTNNCVKVNGSSYAAVVMLAGPRLPGQDRSDRSNVTQYLEGVNASNFPDTIYGNKTYQSRSTSSTSTYDDTFNDVLCYIDDQYLTVTCP